MSITIRVCLIVVSILVFILMMRRIRKEKILISDAVFWIVFSAALLVLSIFPQIIIFAAELLGFQSSTNLVFILIIFILLLKMFVMSLHISHTDCQLRQTVQALAVAEKRLSEAEEKIVSSAKDRQSQLQSESNKL